MEPRKKNLLIRQIAAQAEAMKQQSDSETAFSSANLCTALLEAANSAAPNMSAEETENLLLSFSGINQQLAAFFDLARGKTQVDQELQDSVLRRKTLQQDISAQQDLLNAATEELQKQQEMLQTSKDALNQLKQALQAAEDQRQQLLSELADYTPEKIAQMQKDNQQYSAQLSDAKAKKSALEKKKASLTAELQKLNSEIDVFPAQMHALEKEYAEKKDTLDHLNSLDELYSPEKQAELEAQRKALQDTVEKNQKAVASLNSRIQSLDMQADTSGSERQARSDELLDKLESALQGIEKDLTDQKARLDGVRTTAETLRKNLEACLTEGRRLHDWLDTDVTPLDAMMHALDRTEADELRKTLDPGKIGRIQTLRTEIRERLDALDQILDACSRAAGLDHAAVDRMAGRRI